MTLTTSVGWHNLGSPLLHSPLKSFPFFLHLPAARKVAMALSTFSIHKATIHQADPYAPASLEQPFCACAPLVLCALGGPW